MFFEQLIVMILYLENRSTIATFLTQVIPAFLLLFPNFYLYFFVEGHLESLLMTLFYEFCIWKKALL